MGKHGRHIDVKEKSVVRSRPDPKTIMHKKFQRKFLLVNPKMQLKYILIVVGCFMVISLLLVWDCFWYLKDVIPFDDPHTRKDLIGTFIFMGVKIIALSFFFSLLGLYLSNRVAGPIHRLSRDIIRMSEHADLTVTFTLREKDELHDIAKALNHMVTLLRNRLISEDDFREKVKITSKAMIHLLQDKRQISKSEKEKLIKAGSLLLQESAHSPIHFKV